MKIRIIADSSCDLYTLPGADFISVPLHIMTEQQDYTDDAALDVPTMVEQLRSGKGKSQTACPGPDIWEAAFTGADAVFAVTITSALSGCYNAARCAAEQYQAKHPACRIHLIDSLSTGPEMLLLVRELQRLIASGLNFDAIVSAITEYQAHTRLLFLLSSVQNLARNGRASTLEAKAVGLLGIRLLGQASAQGTLQLLDKFRGESAALVKTVLQMKAMGWKGGPVAISHCLNEPAARQLRAHIRAVSPHTEVTIRPTGGLCSFYAEKGGLLVGFLSAEAKMPTI